MKTYVYKTCVAATDRDAVIDLFAAVKDELYLPNRDVIAKMSDFIFTNGGVTGAYQGDKMVGALGYFFGEPDRLFENKEILFLYVGAILSAYRGTHLFRDGLAYTLQQMQGSCVTEIRLQAETTNPFTNKLYSRFADPIGFGKSLRGKNVTTYGAVLEDALARLERRKQPSSFQFSAPPHAFAPTKSAGVSHGV